MIRSRLAILVAALLLLSWPSASAAQSEPTTVRRTMPANEVSEARDYLLHLPGRLAPPPKRALVVLLHGCSQTATDFMDGVKWNALADEHGFAIAYPEQSTTSDGSGARCWNSGQAPVYPRGQHELETIARITRAVRDELRVPRGRVFIAGLSSGALMTAAMAATYPDLYAAMGSFMGCGYPCGDPTGIAAHDRMGPHARVVPGFFVAGTADYLVNVAMSQGGAHGWAAANDLADDGIDNGSVADQPAIEHRDAVEGEREGPLLCLQSWNNPCPADLTGWRDYPTTVSRYVDANGHVVVESWLLHGLSHNTPDAHPTNGTFTDPHGPDTTAAMLRFFLANARDDDA